MVTPQGTNLKISPFSVLAAFDQIINRTIIIVVRISSRNIDILAGIWLILCIKNENLIHIDQVLAYGMHHQKGIIVYKDEIIIAIDLVDPSYLKCQ